MGKRSLPNPSPKTPDKHFERSEKSHAGGVGEEIPPRYFSFLRAAKWEERDWFSTQSPAFHKEKSMFTTRITELLKIEYPIIGGAMMHLSRAELVGAVSEAGALGIMASAIYPDQESFRRDVRKVKEITSKPFGVNLNMFPSVRKIDNHEYLDVIIEEGVPVVETSGHKAPEEYIRRIKNEGITLIHKCVGVRYAKKAESLGVDAVTVVGYENGGATGTLDVTTLCLTPRVVDEVKVPVIAGGGVCDGRGMAALLALGAEGVIMGTRFLTAEECPMNRAVKEAVVKAGELDTMLALRSIGNTHRVRINETARKVVEMERGGATLEELMPLITGAKAKEMFDQGATDAGLMSCGQGVGLVRDIKPAAEIVRDIIAEARQAIGRLRNMTSRE